MSISIFHIDHLDISDQLDFPSALLNAPIPREKYLLIVGPDLLQSKNTSCSKQRNTYLGWLLEGIVEWCKQKRIIQEQVAIHELHSLLDNDALVPLAYRIEEYLVTKRRKEQCLRDVLAPYSQVEAIHNWLTRIPFLGYITTGYDTCIETAYAQSQHRPLSKFYPSSFAQAIDARWEEQPFILKLYGDLDNPDSVKLGHRLLTGLYAGNIREQLRQLLSETPALFIGFSETDEDLAVLQSLVKDGCIVHQIKPTGSVKQRESTPKALLQKEMPLAVHTLTGGTTTTRKRTTSRVSTPPNTKQAIQKETKQAYKIPIDVYVYYARKDEEYKEEIETLLNGLKTKKGKSYEIIYLSQAMEDSPRYETDRKDPLLSKKLVILLFSRHFFGFKDYASICTGRMQKVVERHKQKLSFCCPILVSTCRWRDHEFDDIEEYILPQRDTSIQRWISQGKDEGEVYTMISDGLEYALDNLAGCLPETDYGA
jgi:SIR2-like domain